MTISEVKGFGRQKEHTEIYRGTKYMVGFIPKVKVKTVVSSNTVDTVIKKKSFPRYRPALSVTAKSLLFPLIKYVEFEPAKLMIEMTFTWAVVLLLTLPVIACGGEEAVKTTITTNKAPPKDEELQGVDIVEHGAHAYNDFQTLN